MQTTSLTRGELATRRAERFARQHGMVRTYQLIADGHSRSMIARMCANGLLFRVHPGVFSNIPGPWSLEARCMAAVYAGGDGALLTGRHAARLQQVGRFPIRGPIHVLVTRRHRPVRGIVFHVTRRNRPGDRRDVGPIPCVSVERLALDLAVDHTVGQVANVMHEGEYRETFDTRRMALLLRHDVTVPGQATASAALQLHQDGGTGTMSELEDRVLSGLIVRGLPMPGIGVPVAVGTSKPIHPDFTWRRERVCLEVDGAPHRRVRSRRTDVERTRLLRNASFHVERAGWSALDLEFDETLDRIADRLRPLVT